jgi:DNA-binding SARP family transcriptional activator
MRYRLRLLGLPALTDAQGRTPPGLGAGKPLAVLCYLAREGEVRRETVTALLWGDTSEGKARNAFRQALHRLRGALGEDVIPHDPETVRIAATADLEVDVWEFERALTEGRPEEAVERVAGEFLEGLTLGEAGFDHWADGERARIRARYLGAVRESAERALREARHADAVRYASLLAREDPLDSSAAVLEARSLVAAGRGAEGHGLLAAHAARFRAEVGEAPPEEVAEVLASLERGGEGSAGVAGSSPSGRPAAGHEPAEPVLRPEALGRLQAAWRGVMDGGSAVVLLTGESGSGKTWLIDELSRRVRPLDRPVVLRGAERMGRYGLPYAPVAEALRPVTRARGLAGASTHLLAEAARLVPELRDRFDLPVLPAIEDSTARLRFYEGVASVLDAVAFEQPVLLVIEGVHLSDSPTVDLLHFLATRLGDAAVLFLLSGEASGAATTLARRLGDRAEPLPLGPVPDRDLAEWLPLRAPELGDESRSAVIAAADGNPGRALELARRVHQGAPLGGPPVAPDDVVRGRIEALAPRARRVLITLALVRRALALRVIAACTHLPEGAVLGTLEPLTRAGLGRERDHGVEVADDRVADLAAATAGPAARALLAGWAAEALAAARESADAELAELSALAGRGEEAARYAEAAGRAAARLGDAEAAAALFRRGLQWTENDEVRARLERLLAAVGQGSRRLGPGGIGSRRGSPPSVRARVFGFTAATVVVLALVFISAVDDAGRAAGDLPGRVVRDTLVLVRTEPDGDRVRLGTTGPVRDAATLRPLLLGAEEPPRRQDTVAMAAGALPLEPLGWAPDGSRMVYRAARGDGGWSLWATGPGGQALPVDTSRDHTVSEAAWSPDGTRIAWTRARPGGPRELRVAFADGSEPRTLVPAEDGSDSWNIAWAPGGERVAFTTDREGGAEIFAVDVLSGRLWRLTWDPAHDDRPAFSPDGAFLAFESTRGGEAGVYVVSSWGGEPARVSGIGQRVAHDGWRGFPPPALSHLRFRPIPALDSGARARVVVEPIFDDYIARHREFIRWRALDPGIVDLAAQRPDGDAPASTAAADTFVVARGVGLGRLAVSAGGWRQDTVWVKVGNGPMVPWTERGRPPLLSDTSFPLGYGLELVARPDSEPHIRGPLRLALLPPPVHPDVGGLQGAAADGPGLWLASADWDPATGELRCRVEREEHIVRLGAGAEIGEIAIRVDTEGRASFIIDGLPRWRSTLRVTAGSHHHRARALVQGVEPVAVQVTVSP